jgi:2-phosphosulfolactate phosphatase
VSAYALAGGARDIVMAGALEEALALRERFPGSLIMGEVDGLPCEQFDFNNSPTALVEADLQGRRLIHRSSAGTQGIVRSSGADLLLAGSFVCAEATARYLLRRQPESVTFVITGVVYDRDGDEDTACADYLTALLRGQRPPLAPFLERVRRSASGQLFDGSNPGAFPATDLDYCTQVDRFDFAMRVERREGLLVMGMVR